MQLAAALSTFKRWAFPAAVAAESTVTHTGVSRVRGHTGPESRVSRRESVRRPINPHAQILDFVAWMRAHDFVARFDSANVVEFYRWFTTETGAPELPRCRMLMALGAHVGVRRTRERLKGPGGRVIKLPSGTPARSVFYRILEAPAVAPTQEPVAPEPTAESAVYPPRVQGATRFAEAA